MHYFAFSHSFVINNKHLIYHCYFICVINCLKLKTIIMPRDFLDQFETKENTNSLQTMIYGWVVEKHRIVPKRTQPIMAEIDCDVQ